MSGLHMTPSLPGERTERLSLVIPVYIIALNWLISLDGAKWRSLPLVPYIRRVYTYDAILSLNLYKVAHNAQPVKVYAPCGIKGKGAAKRFRFQRQTALGALRTFVRCSYGKQAQS